MNQTVTYSVPEMSCGHCRVAIRDEVGTVPGVDSVDVDLETRLVRISGVNLDDAALVAAIKEAGYEALHASPDQPAGRRPAPRTKGDYAKNWIRCAWRYVVDRPLV